MAITASVTLGTIAERLHIHWGRGYGVVKTYLIIHGENWGIKGGYSIGHTRHRSPTVRLHTGVGDRGWLRHAL